MRLGSYHIGALQICLIALLSIVVVSLGESGHLQAETVEGSHASRASSDSTQRLQGSVHRLNAWMTKSKNGNRWRRSLMLNALETQSARGEQANIATLRQVHGRFSSGSSELEQPVFREVRLALEHQIFQLSSSRFKDLFAAVTLAHGQYKPVSIDELEYQRSNAKTGLLALHGYYRETIPSRERADLLHELQLEQAITHLESLEFELPPENSVGKISSQIRGVEARLKVVERQLDALPLAPEEGDEGTDQDKQANSEIEQQRADLQKQQAGINEELTALKTKRSEINRTDRARQAARRAAFNEMRKFEANFVKLSATQGDPYFVSAATSYIRFVRTYFYGTSDNLEEDFQNRLATLEADLLQLDGPNARELAGKVGDHLRWMENANQVPKLVTAIRTRYSHPNIYVSVSEGLLNRIGGQPVNETRPLNENIDGRLVRGTVSTSGQVNIDLQDDPNQVHASIHLVGNLNSSTYVDQGSVRAYASAGGELEGRRSIYANVGGLFANDPYVAANIRAAFHGTDCRLRIVDRIASNKFEEVRYKTESGAARRAEDELIQRFQVQTDEPIQKGQQSLLEAQDRIIPKTNLLPELYVRSFYSEVMAIGKKSSISTLAAPTRPATLPVSNDVAVRIHDSMPNNYLDALFSGKTYSNARLAEELAEVLGETPAALADKSESGKDESFSITFANIRPVQIEFEENGFKVVVSGRRFAQGDTKINEGLKIILRFKIVNIGGELKLVRDGKAMVDYLDTNKKRPATVAFRSFLDGKLNPDDGQEEPAGDLPTDLLPLDKVEAFKNGDLDGKIAKGLRLNQCRAESGWLYLGWNYQEGPTGGGIYDTPAIWEEQVFNELQAKRAAAEQETTPESN